MNEKITKLFKNTRNSIVKHSPEILTGIGIASLLSTTVLAVRATPKVLTLIEDEKNRQNDEATREAIKNNQETCVYITKLKPLDIVKTCWKPYIPAGTALFGTA